jgi:hypothetical protein
MSGVCCAFFRNVTPFFFFPFHGMGARKDGVRGDPPVGKDGKSTGERRSVPAGGRTSDIGGDAGEGGDRLTFVGFCYYFVEKLLVDACYFFCFYEYVCGRKQHILL